MAVHVSIDSFLQQKWNTVLVMAQPTYPVLELIRSTSAIRFKKFDREEPLNIPL